MSAHSTPQKKRAAKVCSYLAWQTRSMVICCLSHSSQRRSKALPPNSQSCSNSPMNLPRDGSSTTHITVFLERAHSWACFYPTAHLALPKWRLVQRRPRMTSKRLLKPCSTSYPTPLRPPPLSRSKPILPAKPKPLPSQRPRIKTGLLAGLGPMPKAAIGAAKSVCLVTGLALS